MGKIFNNINKGFSRIYRILLFVISAFLIIYFFPKSGKFKYNFENGRPWQSENLYAPFDFAIKKTSEEIDNEISQAKLNTPVFFELDSFGFNNIEPDLILAYEKIKDDPLFRKLNRKEKNLVKDQSLKIISEVYVKGLLEENYDYRGDQLVSLIVENKLIKSVLFKSLIKPENLITYINNKIIESNNEKYKSQIISLTFDLINPNLSYKKALTIKALNESTTNISPNRRFVEKETLLSTNPGLVIPGMNCPCLDVFAASVFDFWCKMACCARLSV